MQTRSEGFLCHRDYRTTVPFMRVFFTILFSILFLLNIYPGSKFFLPITLLGLLWSIRQWRFARATWSLEGSKLRNTLMGKTRALDLDETHCISRAKVQCIPIKDQNGYLQMPFYVLSELPAGFRTGIIGYGGPGAIRRLLENGLYLLPVNKETTEMVQRRYPDGAIPEFPEYICL